MSRNNRPRCLEFKPVRANSLLGFATVEFPSGLVMHDVTICRSDNRVWAGAPGKAKIGRDGRALLKSNGKIDYSAVISFSDKEAKRRFEDAVVEAVRDAHPDFEGEVSDVEG